MKVYKTYYQIVLKSGDTIEISKEMFEVVERALLQDEKPFLKIGTDIINRFEITRVVKRKPTSDVEEYIMQQPKQVRDAIRDYAESKKITWKSVDHVSNFISDRQND